MASIAELFVKLGFEVDQSGLNAAQGALGGLKRGLATVAAAAAGFGAAIAGAVKMTAGHADMIDELSQRTGVAADVLQKLGYAASFSGVGFDELAQAMNFLARKGSTDVAGDIGRIADRMKELTDQGRGPEAAALAMEKFGRSGARLVPVLAKGSAELAKMGDRAVSLGQVMDGATLQAGAAFEDALDNTSLALKGLVYTLAGPLLGPLTKVIDAFTDWISNPIFRKRLIETVSAGVEVLGKAFKVVWAVLKPVRVLFDFLTATSARWKATLAVLASVLIYKVGAALLLNTGLMSTLTALTTAWGRASLIAGARAAMAPVIAAAPWVALIAIIGLLIEDIYVFTQGGKSLIGELGTELTKFLDDLFAPQADDPWWLEVLKRLGRFLIDIPGQFPQLVQGIEDTFTAVWDTIRYGFRGVIEDVKGWIVELLAKLPFGLGGKLLGAGNLMNDAWGSVFGGGSSPQAATQNAPRAGGTTVNANKFSAQFTIHAQPGQSPEDIGGEVERRMERFWETKLGEADGAVPGGAY